MPIHDFEVLKTLGKGAFGIVYKVKRKDDGQIYALKKVNISRMSSRERADALNEIRLLASLKHENIVGFLESFVEERKMTLGIVMEYAGGGDMSEKIEHHKKRRTYMNEGQIWDYFIQMCEGIKYLHSNNVLHRDLKSANAFLTSDGKVKIGDLNVSKLMKSGLVQTQIGTPYYMSPEIWQNRPYDAKSDMWAVGCILYEMTTLKVPFLGKDFKELSRRVRNGVYPPLPSTFSRSLSEMIRQLLNLNPSRRPSAADVLRMPQVVNMRKQSKLLDTHMEPISDSADLLATIKMPHNIRALTNRLPKPKYAESVASLPSLAKAAEQFSPASKSQPEMGILPKLNQPAPAPKKPASNFPVPNSRRDQYGRNAGGGYFQQQQQQQQQPQPAAQRHGSHGGYYNRQQPQQPQQQQRNRSRLDTIKEERRVSRAHDSRNSRPRNSNHRNSPAPPKIQYDYNGRPIRGGGGNGGASNGSRNRPAVPKPVRPEYAAPRYDRYGRRIQQPQQNDKLPAVASHQRSAMPQRAGGRNQQSRQPANRGRQQYGKPSWWG